MFLNNLLLRFSRKLHFPPHIGKQTLLDTASEAKPMHISTAISLVSTLCALSGGRKHVRCSVVKKVLLI